MVTAQDIKARWDELENVDNYFKIQQYRFGERLNIQIDIPGEEEGVLQLQCPKLMLQPIVENAIFHGLEKRSEGGTIKVEIEKTDKIDKTSSKRGAALYKFNEKAYRKAPKFKI